MKHMPSRPPETDSDGNIISPGDPGSEWQATHRVPRIAKRTVIKGVPVERPPGETHLGFMATDMKDALDRIGAGFRVHVESPDGFLGLKLGEQIPILWKAVQELSAMVAELQARP